MVTKKTTTKKSTPKRVVKKVTTRKRNVINMNKHVWEGWTVGHFISALEVELDMIMRGQSWRRPIATKAELKEWCKDNQPYYKKYIPDVVNYFAQKYNIR